MAIEIPRFAFIPHRLNIENKPELSDFSHNILFDCAWDYCASALYIPLINTYSDERGRKRMWYVNKNDGNGRVCLFYEEVKFQWIGIKYFVQEQLGIAEGTNWHKFFIQLTMFGCDRREKMQYLHGTN